MEKEINLDFEIYKKSKELFLLKTVNNQILVGFIIKEPVKITRKLKVKGFLNYICKNCKYGKNLDSLINEYLYIFSELLLEKFSNVIDIILKSNFLEKKIICNHKNIIKYLISKPYYLYYLDKKVYLSSENYIKDNIFFNISNLLFESYDNNNYHELSFADFLNIINDLNFNKKESFDLKKFNFFFNINYDSISLRKYFLNRRFNFMNSDLFEIEYELKKNTLILSRKDKKIVSIFDKISLENETDELGLLNNKVSEIFNELKTIYKSFNQEFKDKINNNNNNTSIYYCNYKVNNINFDTEKCKVKKDLENKNFYLEDVIEVNDNIIKKINKIFKPENLNFNPLSFDKNIYTNIFVKNFGLFIDIDNNYDYLLYKEPNNDSTLYSFLLGNVANFDINLGICWGDNKINKYKYNLEKLFQQYINSIFTLENSEYPFLLCNKNNGEVIEDYLRESIFLYQNFNKRNLNVENNNFGKLKISSLIKLEEKENYKIKKLLITNKVQEQSKKIKMLDMKLIIDYYNDGYKKIFYDENSSTHYIYLIFEELGCKYKK